MVVFSYKNELTLKNRFNKSTNILHDKEECKDYIITQSTKDTLSTFFTMDYHNSIALIGPFGCGKSSLLLYINTLLSQNENSEHCLQTLKKNNKQLYKLYESFIKDRKFLKIKIVGEHASFKSQFKNAILEHDNLVETIEYLQKNKIFQMSKTLELLDKDLKKSEYSDVLFSIDEFGKFIEYGLEDANSNDIFDLQTLSEYINKKNSYKLIISLHKTFSEYTNSLTSMTYTDWDKIQGRFENIVFKDNYYEMLNIFKETISLKKSIPIKDSQNLIDEICHKAIFEESSNGELFKKIAPIHPFSAIAISEIFTRYFQNQRSIFSFLFSTEPHAFQEFIATEQEKVTLYSLSNLYEYVSYLLKVYNILLPDREIWYKAEHRLQDARTKTDVKQDIIKSIALIHTFKLSNTIVTDEQHLILSLLDRYSKKEVRVTISELVDENILVYQEQTKSFSLLEDSNININKELKKRLSENKNIDFEKKLNGFIIDKFLVAKKYFVQYGTKRYFEKKYVLKSINLVDSKYKILFSDTDKELLKKESFVSSKSVFIPLENLSHLEVLIKKMYVLEDIREEFSAIISIDTKEIMDNMMNDYTITLEKLLNASYMNGSIFYKGGEYSYSSRKLQEILSEIAKESYPDTPMINSYTFNHTIAHKGASTTTIKKLFEGMLENSHLEYLGIKKLPAEKALYLSVIEKAGIHKKIKDGLYILSEPTELNFSNIWKYISKLLSQKLPLDVLISKLEKEPYGLNRTTALFVISLFVLVHREKVNIFRDNTYTYVLTIDMLMNMWKASQKFQLQLIELSRKEQNLFKNYVEIATDFSEYSYSKDKVVSIIKTLHGKFSILPNYAKQTQKLSKEAIALRSAIISMKDPKDAFFVKFPRALGYADIENIINEEFVLKFKKAFNEVALAYKNEIVEFEKYFSEIFHFESQSFPYKNALLALSKKLEKVESLDTQTKALIRSFTFSHSFLDFINSIAVILINKKLEECYDNDITVLKGKLKDVSRDMLSKLELSDMASDTKDVRKISLASLDSNLNRVISIDKSKLDIINNKALELNKMIPTEYTNDEKLFLISQLLNKELNNA